MRRIIITALAFIGILACASAQDIDYSRGTRWRMANHFPVKGGIGIEQFYMALMPGVSEYFKLNNITSIADDPEGTYEIDKKNGFIRHTVEGDGRLTMECCYWKRDNGQCLVGFYYDEHDVQPDGSVNYDSFMRFYVYNEANQKLECIREPYDEEMSGYYHLITQLPQQGKDIKYRWGQEEVEGPWSTLTWNGYDFRPKALPSSTIREGRHMLSLQWIEDVKYGSCEIKRTGKPGEYTIKGAHYSKDKSNWLKIDGKITVVNARRFTFDGTIKTRIYHIADGEELVRQGKHDFVVLDKRKYWRLEQQCSPKDVCVDYIDIYFN